MWLSVHSDRQKTESHLDQVESQWTQAHNRDGQTEENMAATEREVLATLWSKQNQDRTALSIRMQKMQRYLNKKQSAYTTLLKH